MPAACQLPSSIALPVTAQVLSEPLIANPGTRTLKFNNIPHVMVFSKYLNIYL